jgi:glutamate racemase
MDERPIGVFDSGLGGLTAVREIRSILPFENIIYFGDTSRVPYGGRSREILLKYARQDVHFLRSFDIKALLVACGTVSSNVLPDLQRESDLPILGVVEPVCRKALAVTRNKRVGLIATAASVRSGAYERTIAAMDGGVTVIARACPLFVPLVENGYFGADNAVTRLVARDYLKDIRAAGVDTLILGCTHYPLIAPIIADLMGPEVALIDPGRETALAARDALASAGLLREGRAGTARYYVSDTTESFAQLSDWFLGEYAGGPVTRISVDGYPVEQGAST